MEIAGIRPGRRSAAEVERVVANLSSSGPTYDHIGSTLSEGPPPTGVSSLHVERVVPGDRRGAAAALDRWAPHRGIRATVLPSGPPRLGATVAVVVPVGPVELLVVDRIVAVVDEPDRVGFAYGTLPGHPEQGEELFLATVVGEGLVRLEVTAHSRPVGLAATVPPLVRALQRAAARRYVDAWAAAL